jgi:uncharacterized membrane protein YfcA
MTLALLLNGVALFTLYNLWLNDKPPAKDPESKDTLNLKESLRILMLGALVGFLTTMIGVGGGIFLIIGLRYYFYLSTERSIATSLLASVFIVSAALFGQDMNLIDALHDVPLKALLLLAATATITSFTISSGLDRLPEYTLKLIRKWGLTILVLFTIATTIDQVWIPTTTP